ncbi:type IV pilus assembly protein PilV [Methylomarinovum caldicuralii]|uniref:Type IV pilus assembly protein PilV n=1 Tax=Methylomarinovum caldicuralii TaxID=438856 RepID=A0AAU9CDK3_9GAMM|nr:type IV pilus modification protein PilV [Methylomarinovum caldicuralii]BCX81035.1 type IV pilus assembly protein PilV [Methylomarinovum caldicuralii]
MPVKCRGFTLIEILVAVLVLAIGLLGLAKLQTFGLHSSHGANLRTQATLLAYDMTDRMRANRAGFQGGFYNNPTPADHNCVWDGHAPSVCTPQQMAEHDVWEWNTAVGQGLPQGVGVVCLDATPDDGDDTNGDGTVDTREYACDNNGSLYVVKLWWVDEFDSAGNPVIKRFVTVFQP